MKKFYLFAIATLLTVVFCTGAFATNEILTSLHGRKIGLDVNGDLIVGGDQVTDITASAGSTSATNTTETKLHTGGVRSVKLTCTALDLSFTDQPGTVLYSGTKVYDFPEGLILFLGAVIDGSVTVAADTSGPTFDGDVSLGTATVTGANGTLTSTEADLLISNALTQAVAQVANSDAQSSATQVTESAALWADGTATAKDMYLNFVVDEDASNATGTGSFTGTIEFSYIVIGDN